VLVEHPTHAQRRLATDVLRAEGYETASCAGPEHGVRCPLVEFGNCRVVEDADVVVTTADMADAERFLEAYHRAGRPALVVEAPADELERSLRSSRRQCSLPAR
jgi:hypothetical protein